MREFLALGTEIHLDLGERGLVARILQFLEGVFPGRFFCIRVLHSRGAAVHCYASASRIRAGLSKEAVAIPVETLEKIQLKPAVLDSAHVRQIERWDSPFIGAATGFSIPLVNCGELHGVLDVGYPLGSDRSTVDATVLQPAANHFAVVLAGQRLRAGLAWSRNYSSRVVEHTSALVLQVDERMRIISANQLLANLIGVNHIDLPGTDVRALFHPDDLELVDNLFHEQRGPLAIRMLGAEGQILSTSWSLAAIEESPGSIQSSTEESSLTVDSSYVGGRAVVLMGKDESALSALQGQVIEVEKLAGVGRLAASIAHELNNPLTSITVYSDYLSKDELGLPDEVKEKIERIQKSAQRLQTLAKDLVHYAKPSSQTPASITFDSIIRQAVTLCEHVAAKSNCRVTTAFSCRDRKVMGIPIQLEQVVINLVTNAVQSVGEPGEIRIQTEVEGDTVKLVVEDNGPGIPSPMIEHIFEPFFSGRERGKGTGLGLSIVKQIVDGHRGQIGVAESEAGGARFTVSLPIA